MFGMRVPVSSLLILLALIPGCGGDGGLVPVSGVITLDGQPLPDVAVSFDRPDMPPNENTGWIGRTDSSGRYELRPATGEGSGVPPGKHRVSLTTASANPSSSAAPVPAGARPTTIFTPMEPPPPPERIPPAYRDGQLSFDVPEDGTEEANFALKSK